MPTRPLLRTARLDRLRRLVAARVVWLAAAASTFACSSTPDAPPPGAEPPRLSLPDVVARGAVDAQTTARPAFATLKLRAAPGAAGVRYALEARRDATSLSSRHIVAYGEGDRVLFQYDASPSEVFTDVAVHPSGELTVGVVRTLAPSASYDLLRLSPSGAVLARAPLPGATTLPAGDLGTKLPAHPFKMTAPPHDALTEGWLRVEPRGEGVVVAFLSFIDEGASPAGGGVAGKPLVSGVMALDWRNTEYRESWARIVDGRHASNPAAWTYDELRWRESATRPFLAVDEAGGVVVGRMWNSDRCASATDIFAEFTKAECFEGSVSTVENEYQPFAMTTFAADGARAKTRVLMPKDVSEFVVFDMAVRGDRVALAGAAVKYGPDGTVPYYAADPGGVSNLVPYDGYVAVVDRATATPIFERYVDHDRADVLSALRYTGDGIVAVGGTGWDRWNGGMSISRGADPLVVFVSNDGGDVRARTVPNAATDRHFNLLAVDVDEGGSVLAAGLADGPLTHSGDKRSPEDAYHPEEMTFGGLNVRLRPVAPRLP